MSALRKPQSLVTSAETDTASFQTYFSAYAPRIQHRPHTGQHLLLCSTACLESKKSPLKSVFLFLSPTCTFPWEPVAFVMVGIPINVRSVLGAGETTVNHPAWFVVCLDGTQKGRQGGESWMENPRNSERLTRHKICGRRD